MQRLLINRIPVELDSSTSIFMIVRTTEEFVLNKNRVRWIRDKLTGSVRDQFIKWMEEHSLGEDSFVATEFKPQPIEDQHSDEKFCSELTDDIVKPFERGILKQELGEHLRSKQLFVEPIRTALSFSAYQRLEQFDENYDQYRRIDFDWKPTRAELSLNFGSEKTLISKEPVQIKAGELAFDTEKYLAYRKHNGVEAKRLCPREIRNQNPSAPQKFNVTTRPPSPS